jgi:hypothetical protein
MSVVRLHSSSVVDVARAAIMFRRRHTLTMKPISEKASSFLHGFPSCLAVLLILCIGAIATPIFHHADMENAIVRMLLHRK